MAFSWWPPLVMVTLMSSFPTSARYVPPTPPPCLIGPDCSNSYSRSFVNNIVFCCPDGGGMSVSSINNHVFCHCGNGGIFVSNFGNTFTVNGQQVNASEVQPWLDNMRQNLQRNMQEFQANMQMYRQNLQASMQTLRQNLQAQMASFRQQMNNFGRRMSGMFRFW